MIKRIFKYDAEIVEGTIVFKETMTGGWILSADYDELQETLREVLNGVLTPGREIRDASGDRGITRKEITELELLLNGDDDG